MNELVKALVSQLGVTDDQAAKGSGLIFKAAKERLGGDFSKIEQALPDVARLIQKAPAASSSSADGLGGMIGGLASMLGGGGSSKLGTLASLAGGFSSLKLSPDMIGRFGSVILDFLKSKAGPDILKLLSGVLK